MKSCLLLLADGATARTFEQLLDAGDLPAIAEHVIARGSYRRSSSTFTSTTGPARIPLLTGCFPGTANVPGYRWFDRDAYRGWGPAAPKAFRSYNGPEVSRFVTDIDARCRTLYERLPGARAVYGVINRGLEKPNDVFARRKLVVWPHSHFFEDYVRPDRSATLGMLRALEQPAPVYFVAFPGIDWNGHYSGEAETHAAYRLFDEAVGKAAAALQRDGRYEDTMIMVVSDHGHSRVRTHYDLPVEFAKTRRTAYHSFPAFRPRFDAAVGVSGNAMAVIYLRGPSGWRERPDADQMAPVIEWLFDKPAVDLVATRAGDSVLVQSRTGSAAVRLEGRGADITVHYDVVSGDDPLGYGDLPSGLSGREVLEATFESQYPDGPVQVAQLFRASRCGDIVVSATPGFDLRVRYERPEHVGGHGSLHRDHMLVPIASSVPLAPGPLRTADVAACVLDYLGEVPDADMDGESRLARAAAMAFGNSAAVAKQ